LKSPVTIKDEQGIDFGRVSCEIEHLDGLREQVISKAFATLESRHNTLAQMLLSQTGQRNRAARWMCSHQKAFGGKTGYDIIADGDIEAVWDQVERLSQPVRFSHIPAEDVAKNE
jgi:hypothetical protein